jgi:two-component system response regulator YesN
MNRSYLSSVFKKETGISFTDYVNSLKIEEAKGLIQKYGLRTCEAAEKLGFHDESYFSKLFKKYVGVNPSRVGRSDI